MQRVLIATRDAEFGHDLEEAVRAAGYATRRAMGAADLRALLGDGFVDVLLVCSELVERADVVATLERAVAGDARVRLVVVGRPLSAQRVVELQSLGAVEFVAAPLEVEELEACLARALEVVSPARAWIAGDPAARRLLAAADAAAATDATILITGESGSGASELVRRIHRRGGHAGADPIELDCATLDVESGARSLERAFRRATRDETEGRAGMLVLDHVGELDPRLAPLLIEALARGDEAAHGASPRLIATARRPLRAEVAVGRLPAELAYRFEVIVLRVPPLRERPLDIAPLARQLASQAARRAGVDEPRWKHAALETLAAHPFPGNVAELRSLMERAALLYAGVDVDVDRLFGQGVPAPPAPGFVAETLNLKKLEEVAIRRSLCEARGNRSRASAVLGISVRTLRNKIRLYGLADVGRQL